MKINNITPSSITHYLWVIDGERVFCHHGKPYALNSTEFDMMLLMNDLDKVGVVRLLNFSDKCRQVFAIDHLSASSLIADLQGEFIAYRHIVAMVSPHTAQEISAAIQLLLWRKSHQFCGYCGTKTYLHHKENSLVCPACHQYFYPKIQPCIIIAITRSCPITGQRKILLAQHHRHKDTGMYGLIAGFMEVGESVEMTIHREVMEEVGITVDDICYVKSQPWPYPTNLMLGFRATYQSGDIIIDEEELACADFFSIDDLPLIPKEGTIAHTLIRDALSF